MIDPLIRKLDQLGPLSTAEKRALTGVPLDVQSIGPDQDLMRAGSRPSDCKLIVEGFVCRYKTIEGGRRQIVSFHIPGDIVDLNSLLLGEWTTASPRSRRLTLPPFHTRSCLNG